ncbi:hypothetical protein NL386_37530, partial [Klebsiella pneumoniae]|nr:hypothetical protein [Klebsiella pneumoniae]
MQGKVLVFNSVISLCTNKGAFALNKVSINLTIKAMITEKDFQTGIAEIILSVFDNQSIGLTKAEVCSDGHFSPKMLTSK